MTTLTSEALFYPDISHSEKASGMRFFLSKEHHRYKRGPAEIWLALKMKVLRCSFLRNDVSITVDGHRYEPDFAYVDEDRGIYLDIELDEPYSGRNHPCHCVDGNMMRNETDRTRRLTTSGWTVIRFSERQMFSQTMSCIGFVAREIAARDISFREKHSKLISMPEPDADIRWTTDDSYRMMDGDYRYSYLGFHVGRFRLREIARFVMREFCSMVSGEWRKR